MKACEGRRRRSRARHARTPLAIALMLALSGQALGDTQLSYEAGFGARHHDNISLSEDDPIEEDVLFGSLRFVAKGEGPQYEFNSRGNIRYLNYLGGSFDDEFRGELSAQLDWTLMPNRLHWVFEDYASRQEINILESPAPGNQQQVNVFVTGPTFLARLGSATRAQVDLRYINSYAEETEDFNGNRMVARLGIIREISPTTQGSFNLEAADVDFDEGLLSSDYRRYDAYASFRRTLPAMVVRADLGYTWLEPSEELRDTASYPLLRVSVDWRPSSRNTFTLRADQQFADAAQSLIRRSSELANETYASVVTSEDLLDLYDRIGNTNLVVSSDAYRERRLDLGYRHNGDRLTVRVHPYVQRNRYEEDINPTADNLDRDSQGAAIGLDYRLRQQLELSLRATMEDIEYRNISRDDRVSGVSLSLADRSARRWRWRIDLDHIDRESSVVGSSYTDNAIGFSMTYRR